MGNTHCLPKTQEYRSSQLEAQLAQGQNISRAKQGEGSRQPNTLISRLDMERLNVMEMFHGISFPGHLHTQDSLQLALKFPFQESDILIASYPKSGKERGEPRRALSDNKSYITTCFCFLVDYGICWMNVMADFECLIWNSTIYSWDPFKKPQDVLQQRK